MCTTCRAARRAAWRRRCSASTWRSYRTRGSACLGASTTSREACSGSRSAPLPRIRACLSTRLSSWAAPACRARCSTSIATRLARHASPPTRTRCSRTTATTSRTSVRSSCWASESRSRYSTCRGPCSRLRWGRCCAPSSRRWAAPLTRRSATATPPQPHRRHSRARCPSRPTPPRRVCWRRCGRRKRRRRRRGAQRGRGRGRRRRRRPLAHTAMRSTRCRERRWRLLGDPLRSRRSARSPRHCSRCGRAGPGGASSCSATERCLRTRTRRWRRSGWTSARRSWPSFRRRRSEGSRVRGAH
mmetsp:Transcript_22089/g.65533  ORF Transcript_22089/g.65533 Transcript_22089/m.65533 type:complete len:301 (-) Transcript_22089:254-1156(-)